MSMSREELDAFREYVEILAAIIGDKKDEDV